MSVFHVLIKYYAITMSLGTSVAAFVVTDADSASVTVSINSGDTGSKFAISGNDVVTTANAIDYESMSASGYTYTLVLRGTDGTNTGTSTVVVTVQNVNDNTPSMPDASASVSLIVLIKFQLSDKEVYTCILKRQNLICWSCLLLS